MIQLVFGSALVVLAVVLQPALMFQGVPASVATWSAIAMAVVGFAVQMHAAWSFWRKARRQDEEWRLKVAERQKLFDRAMNGDKAAMAAVMRLATLGDGDLAARDCVSG